MPVMLQAEALKPIVPVQKAAVPRAPDIIPGVALAPSGPAALDTGVSGFLVPSRYWSQVSRCIFSMA
jgi:hypothetical protein